jgi:hypothetical protein
MRVTRQLILATLAGGWLAFATPARAAEGGFTATLSADEQAAAGLTAASPGERTALDQFVAGELGLIRNGATTELPGSFISRRTEAERKSAGLDRLTEAQLEKLNELVASVLADRPKPKERPRLKESDVLAAAPRNRIHGSVTVGYGWGGGGDMWTESLWLEYYDPSGRFSLGLGLSNFSGDGYYGYYPYGYGGPYYNRMPVSFETSFRGGAHGDFSSGQGQSFRGTGGRAPGPGTGRNH